MKSLFASFVVLAVGALAHAGDGLGPGIDVSAFEEIESSCEADTSNVAYSCCSEYGPGEQPGFYLAGIVGGSFAKLTNPDLPDGNTLLNQSLFTAGGAAGWSFARPRGALRVEFEARGREQMMFTESDPFIGSLSFRADDGWSTIANVWRDYRVRGPIGIYLGGGVGAGGYRGAFDGNILGTVVSGATGISSFAWQAGGGTTYAFSERLAIDVGYRFFSLGPGSTDIVLTNAGGTVTDTVRTQFSASELLLSLRLYEPFRRWR